MTQYKCVKRLSTDGGKTVHEVGEIVTLTDAEAQIALKLGAVVPYQSGTPPANQSVQQLEQEEAQIKQEIAADEKGAQS